MLAALVLTGCSKAIEPTPIIIYVTPEPTAEPAPALEPVDLEVPLTFEELSDVSDWEWTEEYGYFIVDNERWDSLTVWYDPFEESCSISHPYSSLSDEHLANGDKVYPINRCYINENGNMFIPFVFTELKHPEYVDDGDGVYWLLYKNFNGVYNLDYHPPASNVAVENNSRP